MHLRPSYLIGFVGALVLLIAPSASAQALAVGSSGLQELQFTTAGSVTCSSAAAASDDNIVWGTTVQPTSCTTAAADDNIVWGTLVSDDNIVWGTGLVQQF